MKSSMKCSAIGALRRDRETTSAAETGPPPSALIVGGTVSSSNSPLIIRRRLIQWFDGLPRDFRSTAVNVVTAAAWEVPLTAVSVAELSSQEDNSHPGAAMSTVSGPRLVKTVNAPS